MANVVFWSLDRATKAYQIGCASICIVSSVACRVLLSNGKVKGMIGSDSCKDVEVIKNVSCGCFIV